MVETPVSNYALLNAVNRWKWEETRELLKRTDASRLVQHTDNDGDSTLYWACYRNAPVDIVEAIHKIHPSLITKRSVYGGTTPIDYACRYSPEDLVKYLLRAGPHTVALADNSGWLPLHYAVFCRRSPSVIKLLLLEFPSAINATDIWGETSLHVFVNLWSREIEKVYPYDLHTLPRRDVNKLDGSMRGLIRFQESLSLLLMAYVHGNVEDSFRRADQWLLLHEALRVNTVSIAPLCMQVLIKLSSRTESTTPDKEGNFPLHLACARPPRKQSDVWHYY